MAYSLNTDVTNEFKTIDTSGLVTTTKIDGWIAQADAYIDSRIGLVYEVPVTGVSSLLILKQISIWLVAQRIADIMETKSIVPKGNQLIPKNLERKAEKKIQMIVDRELLLSDATLASSHNGVKSYTNDNPVTRTFDVTKDQW
jgi:hypothetical protein